MSDTGSGESLKLSQENKNKADKWLSEKWDLNKYPCDVCGKNQWILGEHLVQMFVMSGEGIHLGGTVYPFIVAMCSNCANSKLFNAAMMGILNTGGSNNE